MMRALQMFGTVVLFAAAMALFLATLPGARAAEDLERPVILVAAPALEGHYRATVLIAVPVDGQHLGFILNRPTQTTMAKAFPDSEPAKEVRAPIYFGGPEFARNLFAMVSYAPGKPSIELLPGVHLTGDAAKIDEIIERTPNEARYYAGFVSWAPGELAEELAKGWFHARPVDAALLFLPDTAGLHERLARPAGPSVEVTR